MWLHLESSKSVVKVLISQVPGTHIVQLLTRPSILLFGTGCCFSPQPEVPCTCQLEGTSASRLSNLAPYRGNCTHSDTYVFGMHICLVVVKHSLYLMKRK